jgi:uncharacterized membrane protein
MRYDDDQLESLRDAVHELRQRVAALEQQLGARQPPAASAARPPRRQTTSAAPPPPRQTESRRPARPALSQIDLEDVLGGRALAWIGGSAVLLGIVFFLAMAVSRGWIDEPTRTVLAALGSTFLVVLGTWLHESRGQTEAALAAVASGLAGLFATLVVATQVYDLVDAPVGLVAAGVVGAVATTVAVRWEAPVLAVIGIVGALLAPVLVGAGTSNGTLAFMAIALCSAVGVLLWQRWNWLALAAFAVSAPQLLAWVFDDYSSRVAWTLVVLGAFWALYVVAAVGYELRARTPSQLPVASWFLLVADVVLLAAAGYRVLEGSGHGDLAVAWIVFAAAVHVALGVATRRWTLNRELGSVLISAGLVLSAIAFADALDGPVLVAGWGAQAVLLAYLARRAPHETDGLPSSEQRLSYAAAAYLALGVAHVLLFEAQADALRYGVDSLAKAAIAILLVSAAAFAVDRLRRDERPELARVAEVVGAAGVVYLPSVAIVDLWGVERGDPRQLGQLLLSAFWTAAGLAAMLTGLLAEIRRLRVAGLALLGLAIAKVFAYDLSELEEIYRVVSFIALGLLLLVGAFAYARIRNGSRATAS